MPERPTKEEIEAYEVRYLKDMADRYGGQLEAEAARRRARLKEKARRAREQFQIQRIPPAGGAGRRSSPAGHVLRAADGGDDPV